MADRCVSGVWRDEDGVKGRAFAGRGAWSIVSQSSNTATNLVLSLAVARESSSAEYGAWAIAYALFVVGLAINRAVVSTPLLISSDGGAKSAASVQSSIGASVMLSIFLMLSFAVGVWLLPESVAPALVVFGVVIPGVLVHDTLRYYHFGRSSPRSSAILDTAWLVVQFVLFATLMILGRASMVALTVAWGIGASLVAIVYLSKIRALPSIMLALQRIRSEVQMTSRLFVDAMLTAGAANCMPLIIGSLLGLSEAGYLRGAQTLMGGVGLVVMGLTPMLTVEAVKVVSAGGSIMRLVRWWSLMIAIGSAAYGALVLLIPDRWGTLAIGDSFHGATLVLPALVCQAILRGPFTGTPALLKAQRRFDDLVRLRIRTSVSTVALPTAGAIFWGLEGAVWGMAAAAVVADLQSLYVLRRAS